MFSSHDSHLSPNGGVTYCRITSSVVLIDGVNLVKLSVVSAKASRNVASLKSGLTSSMTQTLLQFGHFIVPAFFIRLTQLLQNTCSHGKTCGSVKNSVQMTQFVNSSALVAILNICEKQLYVTLLCCLKAIAIVSCHDSDLWSIKLTN